MEGGGLDVPDRKRPVPNGGFRDFPRDDHDIAILKSMVGGQCGGRYRPCPRQSDTQWCGEPWAAIPWIARRAGAFDAVGAVRDPDIERRGVEEERIEKGHGV